MGLSTYLSDFREQIDCYENLSADKINRGTVIWKMEANLGEVRTLLADDMENSIKNIVKSQTQAREVRLLLTSVHRDWSCPTSFSVLSLSPQCSGLAIDPMQYQNEVEKRRMQLSCICMRLAECTFLYHIYEIAKKKRNVGVGAAT